MTSVEGCAPGASEDGQWDFYQADGVEDICGEAPPGMDDDQPSPRCPDGEYQVTDGFGGGPCVKCYQGCQEGYFLAGCGGTMAGTCQVCEACPAGQIREGCGGSEAGQCTSCPAISGPFKGWVDGLIPCKFNCFPPAQPNGLSCTAPTTCDNTSATGSQMLAHKNEMQQLLALGNCAEARGQVFYGSQVVTHEAKCGNKFKPFRFHLEFLGEGEDKMGQWTIRDCDTMTHLTVMNKTLHFHGYNAGQERFTFRPSDVNAGTYHLLGSGTQECIKAAKKPGFQLMECPNCCDSFVFAETDKPWASLA